jgi:hypothetical protein
MMIKEAVVAYFKYPEGNRERQKSSLKMVDKL